MKIRHLINLFEDPKLKKEIIGVVNATDDLSVLHRVLNVLKSGNIDDRIKSVIGKDADAQRFIKQIINIILQIDAPVEEKDTFLKLYAKGKVINTSKLLNGKLYNFADLVGTGFTLELFKRLTVELVSQGVGPGEIALAVLSPDIAWSGRSQGGGDIQINKKPVEVKTRVSKGGRWINARKAKMDVTGIINAVATALKASKQKITLPDRLNPEYWVNDLRPRIDPKLLKATVKKMADGMFTAVPNIEYQKALLTGDASAIVYAITKVGYNNYKKYSGFDGMLLMDVPTETFQYFQTFEEMAGSIKVATAYLFAPESEMMPQVVLAPGAGPIRAGKRPPIAPPAAQTKGGATTTKAHEQQIYNFAAEWAQARGIVGTKKVTDIAKMTTQLLGEKLPKENILKKLNKLFPNETKIKPAPIAPADATSVTEPEIEPIRQRRTNSEIPRPRR